MNKTPLLEFVFNRKKTAGANKEGAVELRITFERKQKYMTTGIRVLPKQWHRGTIVNRLDALQLNQTLEKLLAEVRQVILDMMDEGCIDIFAIPDNLKRKKAGNITFIEFCFNRAEIRKMNKAGDSQERYDRFLKFFVSWGKIVTFDDITDVNIKALDDYLAKKKFKPYSIWNNYHRFLNSFIIDAVSEGYIHRNPYKWVPINKEKSKGGIGKYLSPSEFEQVKTAALPSESLQRVRDVFVFQTYTCLSFTDLKDFDPSKIQEVKGMKVYMGKRAKTDQPFTIPLLPQALAVLKKYKNNLPVISNVKYNEYLKVVAQAAGIDKPLSSHWARHTRATLLLNGGTDMRIVSKICGHSSNKSMPNCSTRRWWMLLPNTNRTRIAASRFPTRGICRHTQARESAGGSPKSILR